MRLIVFQLTYLACFNLMINNNKNGSGWFLLVEQNEGTMWLQNKVLKLLGLDKLI